MPKKTKPKKTAKPKQPAREKKSGCVKVCKLEVSGLSKDDLKRWDALGESVRGIVNATWQAWLVWHIQNGSAAKLAEYMRVKSLWHDADEATRGEPPKWPVEAMPKACDKATYDALAAMFPEIETTAREQCRRMIRGKIKNFKAANGSTSGWVAILLCRQSLPSTVRANPIPFSKKNSEIEPPAPGDKDAQWKLHVKVTRIPPKGGKKCGTAVMDTVKLWSKGRKAAGQVAILKKIAAGEYEFLGSQLVHDEGKRKWFAYICYRSPLIVHPELDASKVAILRPVSATAAWPHPWKLRMPGTNRAPGGDGRYIGGVRRKIIAERISRQRGYRNAGSANKGHGRNRALQPIWHLQQRWKEFERGCNYNVCRDVVNQCVERGVGKLVYIQPTANKDTRFLSCAGKDRHQNESSSWDWSQVKSRLETLCKEHGIVFVGAKSRDKPSLSADAAHDELIGMGGADERPRRKERGKPAAQLATCGR